MTFSGHQQVHAHSCKLTSILWPPNCLPIPTWYIVQVLITANIRQVFRAVQHQTGTMWALFPLLTVSPPPTSPSLPPCLPQRFAVLQMSLAPCSFCPTSLSAAKSIFEDNLRCAAPWWLGFDATAPPSVPPTLKNLPRTDSHVTAI